MKDLKKTERRRSQNEDEYALFHDDALRRLRLFLSFRKALLKAAESASPAAFFIRKGEILWLLM